MQQKPHPHYYIGLPQWNHPLWQETALQGARQTSALSRYSRYFNSVEGNSTFYALPDATTQARWLADTPEAFRFCCKFSREISHEGRLSQKQTQIEDFLAHLAPLHSRIGLINLQLPAQFSPAQLDELASLLSKMPSGFEYGVEVRHLGFFDKGEQERAFNQLLHQNAVNRIMFDTRALFALPTDDKETLDALAKKPRVPLHVIATGQAPMARIITPLDFHQADDWISPWIGKVCQWLDEGRTPWLFFHTPNNRQAPELAAHFCQLLESARPGLEGFRPWPQAASQAQLF